MIKRNFYLTLMWLWNIMFFSTTFYLSSLHIANGLGFFFIIILITFIFHMIFIFISDKENNDVVDLDTYCPFITGFFTLRRKKIYYSDLGYFWIRQKGNKIIVSKQSWFFTKELFKIGNNGNIESIKNEIKKELEYIYKLELEKKRKKKLIEDWDGYIDTVSKRDDIINKIIK